MAGQVGREFRELPRLNPDSPSSNYLPRASAFETNLSDRKNHLPPLQGTRVLKIDPSVERNLLPLLLEMPQKRQNLPAVTVSRKACSTAVFEGFSGKKRFVRGEKVRATNCPPVDRLAASLNSISVKKADVSDQEYQASKPKKLDHKFRVSDRKS